jgi:thioredoxin reductase
LLGQDGASPSELFAKGKAEVLAYPTAEWRDELASELCAIPGGFSVRAASGEYPARRLILATGVVDELPSIAGLAERWGKSVFHCPYCDGYERARGRLGVLATSPLSMRYARLVAEWSAPGQTTLFLDQRVEPSPEELAELVAAAVAVEREKVAAVEGPEPGIVVRLQDGRTSALSGLFVTPPTRLPGGFAEQLGCELEQGPVGPFFKTDESKETSVPGVFACGDAALAKSTVSFAIADGARAGIGAHQSLVFRADAGR